MAGVNPNRASTNQVHARSRVAFFKYQFPLTRKMVGFKEVEVEVTGAPGPGTAQTAATRDLALTPLETVSAQIPAGHRFPGRYVFHRNLVITAFSGPAAGADI